MDAGTESFGSPFLLYYGAKGVAMTKTEFVGQNVEELRAALLELFEDENGAIAEANKKELVEFTKDNWDYIDSAINTSEEDDERTTEEEDQEVTDEVPVVVAQPEDIDLSKPNPKTDLYTGRLGE